MKARYWIPLALTVLGLVTAAFADGDDFGPEHVVPNSQRVPAPMGREHIYRSQGGNPRSRVPVKGWADALEYWESPAFQNDLKLRLVKGLPPGFRGIYLNGMVPACNRYVHQARQYNFPFGKDVPPELRHTLVNLQVPNGTKYLAVTFGSSGKVEYNMEVRARGSFRAYRVWLRGIEVKCFQHGGKRVRVLADSAIDLMAICRNAGLSGTKVWEVEAVQCLPPMVPLEATPEVCEVKKVEKTEATAEASAKAEVGDTIIYYPSPAAPVMAYNRPGQVTTQPWQYQAGVIGVTPIPKINVSQFQQQAQSQLSQQFMDFWQQIINNNINQNEVNVPVSTATGG